MLYNYCHNPEAERPIMLITKHIGYDETDGMGVDGAMFQRELLSLDDLGKQSIDIWINSPGGNVMEGMNIYNAILKTKTKVNTFNIGICASIAAVIFQAGRTRHMSDYAKLMYHNPYGADAATLEPIRDAIAVMIAERVKSPKDEILSIMRKTTWIGAEEALKSGFCDVIDKSSEQNKRRATTAAATEDVVNLWRVGNEILNSIIISPKQPKSMKRVCNKLGLNDEANESAVLEAISNMENKHKEELGALQGAKNKLDESLKAKEKELTETKDKLEKITAEKEKAEKEKAEAEEKEKAEAVKNLLDGYVKQGRITKESVEGWKEVANALGVDKLKKQLDAIPVSKAANKISVQGGGAAENNDKALTSVVAQTMIAVKEKIKS